MHRAWIAFLGTVALSLSVLTGTRAAHAQRPVLEPAQDPIQLIVPFPPGGGAEFTAQQLENALRKTGGPALRIVHRAGDGGVAGADHVARSAPDGRTLLLGSRASLVFGPMTQGRRPFDPLAEFEPVAIIATIPRLILVHPSVPATSIDALIRIARSDPAALPCGTADGVSEHAVRSFQRMAGVTLNCIAYPGVSPALRQDLLAGKIRLAFESALLPDVLAGSLRAIAVAGASALRALPGVPTASESGLPAYDVSVWIGLFAPAKTPAETIAQLAPAVQKAMEDPDTQAAFHARGYVVRVLTGRALRNFLETDQRDTARQAGGAAR